VNGSNLSQTGILIDTNIVSAHFKGDPAVTRKLQTSSPIYLPAVVLGELHFGALRSSNPTLNQQRIERFTAAVEVLVTDSATAWFYGQIKAELAAAGTMIPDNDLWIAAVAKQYDVTLISRDHHFGQVLGLKWTIW
jgi:tRNA(fMet)-specific endonuclease VapC